MIGEIVAFRAVSERPLKTRWKPVDLACHHSESELVVRTKLVRDADTAAVCIAEAISHAVLVALGLQPPDCHAVVVEGPFAEELTRQYSFEPHVLAGHHWGTTYLENRAQEIEFHQSHIELLESPTDIFTLFLGDVLLGNPDRLTHGNLLLGAVNDAGKGALIPIDHSDCFNHPYCLRNPACLIRNETSPIAGWLPGTESVLLGQEQPFARRAMEHVTDVEASICDAVGAPPDGWYDLAGVDPASLENFLRGRVRNIKSLAQLQYWENLHGAIGGGQLLDL